ncbi:hypothetical protein [Halobacillus sp. A5]|uniref:hypothetical protein n=1 Tax=Halobacillus sp. A5 TaxID=2880263 RepID=UPI0020A696E0|nr:hypothetical protein [Halobacillus sp. A5]MCP3025395.1 hypothetical protein [Halobacillus sp. A5]
MKKLGYLMTGVILGSSLMFGVGQITADEERTDQEKASTISEDASVEQETADQMKASYLDYHNGTLSNALAGNCGK